MADWTPLEIVAVANVYLGDFMLFDVSKPISDTSYLEIEKSTLRGKPYQTGGGWSTIDANVVDIMVTWMVNNDQKFLRGGSASPRPSQAPRPFPTRLRRIPSCKP